MVGYHYNYINTMNNNLLKNLAITHWLFMFLIIDFYKSNNGNNRGVSIQTSDVKSNISRSKLEEIILTVF